MIRPTLIPTAELLAIVATTPPEQQTDTLNNAWEQLCSRHTQAYALAMLVKFVQDGFVYEG